jgi:ribose-phosphate pyrophosphokinase
MKIFSGSANRSLTQRICHELKADMGKCKTARFSDGEVSVDIQESIRGKDVFFVQSTNPPAENLMEVLVFLDAAKRASAESITAVIPYFGYARQDRKATPRAPITAKLVADLITLAGADRVLTIDLHAGQIQGFFSIPVDNLYAKPVILGYIKEKKIENLCVVSPDAGGVERARAYAKSLKAELAILDKRRPIANESEVLHIIGDVNGMTCLFADDIVDTAGTLTNGAIALLERKNEKDEKIGAKKVIACCPHPVLSGPAITRLANSPIEELIVTDTIPLSKEAELCGKIKVLSVAGLLAEAIERTHQRRSVSELFI